MDSIRTIKLAIGIPTAGQLHIETALALIHSLNQVPGCEIQLIFHKGTYLHQLRNNIVSEAREMGADYLMFIDTDMVFEPAGIKKLLSHKLDIVGGAYNMKCLPPVTTIKLIGEDGKFRGDKNFSMPTELFECGAVATGFMLIRMDAVRDIPQLFDFSKDENGQLIGEDVWFCIEARKRGLKIYCDPTVKLGHIGEYVF